MELQQQGSNPRALCGTTSRNLSSSSSAFVSANQSPFFSPRSPTIHYSEPVQPGIASPSNGLLSKADNLASNTRTGTRQLATLTDIKFLEPDVSRAPCLCTSSNFRTPGTVYINSAPSSSNSRGTGHGDLASPEKQKRPGKSHGKFVFSWPSASIPSAHITRSCDVYIGFHGDEPSLRRFADWLRAELEIQGISCFASDRTGCRNAQSRDNADKIMNASTYGVVILARKSFVNPCSIDELRVFSGKKNLVPIYFDLGAIDCLARDIIEQRGELWEKHGGELWMLYGGLEKEWREAVDALSRALDAQLEANDGNWRECIFRAVVLLAKRLGKRSVVDRENRWRERLEEEEFPFPRNNFFIGRRKELSQLELILFGDVSGDGEREYFELKTKNRRRSSTTIKEQQSQKCSKGKEPVLWKESEKEIEMHRLGGPLRHCRPLRVKNGSSSTRKKRSAKMLYGKGIACVSGESGIGKTELILEYAYRFAQRYKAVLWVGGESRYIQQNYLALRAFLEVDSSIIENHSKKGGIKCFEEQEEEAIAGVRKELMRDVPFLVVIDNLENERDWWDQKDVMDLLPRFGGATHFIITTRLPRVMNLEPMKLSYLSGVEAMSLMKGDGLKDYPLIEIDALKAIEEKLGRLTLGLGIVGAILSELPITPSRLLDTINQMPFRELAWNDREALTVKEHAVLVQLLDVCLSIFDNADHPRSLAARMVQVSGWFAPSAIPIHLLALAAQNFPKEHHGASIQMKWFKISRMKKSESKAASMLTRFRVARFSTKPDCIQLHELIKLYARNRGAVQVAQAMVQAVYHGGSVCQSSEHLWAACFLVFGFGSDPVIVEPRSSDLLYLIKHVVIPLSIQTYITFARCNAALELLCLATNALELAVESVSRADKHVDKPFCCFSPARSEAQHTCLWQELVLLKATVLETRAKLMLRGGKYDTGEDLIRKAIFIRVSICGERHSDTLSARETLSKLTRLLANVQVG